MFIKQFKKFKHFQILHDITMFNVQGLKFAFTHTFTSNSYIHSSLYRTGFTKGIPLIDRVIMGLGGGTLCGLPGGVGGTAISL